MSILHDPSPAPSGADLQRRLDGLLDAAADATLIVDQLGKILVANALAEEMFGYERGELAGRDLEELMPERFRAEHRRHRAQFARTPRPRGMGSGLRLAGQRRDGSEFPVEVSLNSLGSHEGAAWTVAAVRDISDRVEREQLAHQNEYMAQSVQVKATFLASMSHELRTPLNAVIGFAELLSDELAGPLNDQQKEFLNNILSGARHLHGLIDGMLDLARIQAGKMDFHPSIFVLSALVAEVCDSLRMLAARKHIALDVDVDPALETVSLDATKLKQVLINLIGNAIKFTPDGGAVSVRARPEDGGMFRLEVEDTGPGIAADQLGKLFVEFQQLELGVRRGQEGMGLGLALTKHIVEGQGGRVGVTSTPGRGSVFHAALPLRHQVQRATSTSTSSLSRPKRSTT